MVGTLTNQIPASSARKAHMAHKVCKARKAHKAHMARKVHKARKARKVHMVHKACKARKAVGKISGFYVNEAVQFH